MSETLTTKITTEPAEPIYGVLPDGAIDFDGSGFEEPFEDEKGDFAPTPLHERLLPPSHPGEVLRELYLPKSKLSQGALAQRLGVSRRTVNMVLNGTRPVTVDMAHRLGRVFGTSALFWLSMQQDRDVWHALHANRDEYERLQPLRTPSPAELVESAP